MRKALLLLLTAILLFAAGCAFPAPVEPTAPAEAVIPKEAIPSPPPPPTTEPEPIAPVEAEPTVTEPEPDEPSVTPDEPTEITPDEPTEITPVEPTEITPVEPTEITPAEPTEVPPPDAPPMLESVIKHDPTRFTAEMGQNYIPANRIICLDPGHGGRDGGAVYNGRVEKDDNLSLALAVADELTARGFTPILTRTDDSSVSLDERPAIANEAEASYFVSLHRNSVDADANLYGGVEIWASSYRTDAEKKLANAIMDGLKSVGISQSRGVLFGYWDDPLDDYRVNRKTLMPSCIVELGFITSDEDNRLFDEHFSEYAAAIADAIASLYPAA